MTCVSSCIYGLDCSREGLCLIRRQALWSSLDARQALASAIREDDQLRQLPLSASQEYARDNYMLPDDTNPYEKRHTEQLEARPKLASKY